MGEPSIGSGSELIGNSAIGGSGRDATSILSDLSPDGGRLSVYREMR